VQDVRCYNDVHMFNTEELRWRQQPVTGQLPQPRGGHSASLAGRQIFVFGGASGEETFGDLYKFDLIKSRWHRGDTSGSRAIPCARTNHAAAADANGIIYIFGGYGSDGHFLNDLWALNIANKDGFNVLPGDQFSALWMKPILTGPIPRAREGHSLTLVDRKLVLFGGYTEGGRSVNDIHIYDTETQDWKRLEINGCVPQPRQAHSAVRHGRDVVIAGGCDVSEPNPMCFSDVWSFSLLKQAWTKQSSDTLTWFKREGHSATFVRGKMYLFGGCKLTSDCYNDMSVLDTFDACPDMCGRHGECVHEEFCRCTVPGFTGHDCLQPVSCRTDCGPHGSCGEDGECVCEQGWAGPDCTLKLPNVCPGAVLQCSGQGACRPDGRCACWAGYLGDDCSIQQPTTTLPDFLRKPARILPPPANHTANAPKKHARTALTPPMLTTPEPRIIPVLPVCPYGCSQHGVCLANNKCKCDPNWYGVGCNKRHDRELVVPREHKKKAGCVKACCSHGMCYAGNCRCRDGWHGPACAVNRSTWEDIIRARNATHRGLLERVQQHKREIRENQVFLEMLSISQGQIDQSQQAESQEQVRELDDELERLTAVVARLERQARLALEPDPEEEMSKLDPKAVVCPRPPKHVTKKNRAFGSLAETDVSFSPVRKPTVKPPENKDFGIDTVNQGSAGKANCPHNCHFRGLCVKGVCYCQPGFTDSACQTKKQVQKTVDLLTVISGAAGCLLAGFLVTIIILCWSQHQKRQKEVATGYNV